MCGDLMSLSHGALVWYVICDCSIVILAILTLKGPLRSANIEIILDVQFMVHLK